LGIARHELETIFDNADAIKEAYTKALQRNKVGAVLSATCYGDREVDIGRKPRFRRIHFIYKIKTPLRQPVEEHN
jgi:hypothetical protein